MITAAQLAAAPIGSWITYGSEFAMTINRTHAGWMLFRRGAMVPHSGPRDPAMYSGTFNRYHLHIPAPIRLWSWQNTVGTPYYSWKCRVCPECADFDVCFADPSEAHDKARSHASLHAEVTAP